MANKRITEVDYVDSLNSNESFFINQNNGIKQINKSEVIQAVINGFGDAENAKTVKENLGLGAIAEKNIVPISNGGTGATTAANALSNLGALSKSGDTMNGTLYMNSKPIILSNGHGIKSRDASGTEQSMLYMNGNDGIYLGYEPIDGLRLNFSPIIALPNSNNYGNTLPKKNLFKGRLFFKKS